MFSGDHAHGGVGVSSESSLEKWRVNCQFTDVNHRAVLYAKLDVGYNGWCSGFDLIPVNMEVGTQKMNLMKKLMKKSVLFLVLFGAAFGLSGCEFLENAGLPEMNLSPDYLLLPDRPKAAVVAKLADIGYPDDVVTTAQRDILLVRKGAKLTIYNRTAHVYRDFQLWLNGEYVAVIDELKIGRLELGMRGFINEYGESFPVGHFLSPNKAYPVVLAEIVGTDKKSKQSGNRVKYLLRVQIGKDINRVGS